MVLVTLGTQTYKFERLLEIVEQLIIDGKITEKVIVQSGNTNYKSEHMELFSFVSMEELSKLISECSILITHAGVGSIMEGLNNGKKVVVLPRLAKYNEHVNDHQEQIVEGFIKGGYIISLEDFDKIDEFEPKCYESGTDKIVDLIEDFIQQF